VTKHLDATLGIHPAVRAVIAVALVAVGLSNQGGTGLIVIGGLLFAWSVIGLATRARR
jgi:hypothetical protein